MNMENKVITIPSPKTAKERETIRQLMERTRGAYLNDFDGDLRPRKPMYFLPWHPTTKYRVDK